MTVSRTPTFWDERWRWGSVVVVTVIAGFVLVVLADNRFFYSDDTESGAVPNWVLGNLMRNGHLVPGSYLVSGWPETIRSRARVDCGIRRRP